MRKGLFLWCIAIAMTGALFTHCTNTNQQTNTANAPTQGDTAAGNDSLKEYAQLPYPQNPDEALQRLKEGNTRFVNDDAIHPNRDDERKILQSKGQTPFASIMSCSDSRVPSEIVFDQGLGDLFLVRTAGQVMAEASIGSLEFSVAVLGTKLIVVMGHEKCGAVNGAIGSDKLPGEIEYLVEQIRPAIAPYRGKPEALEDACKANILYQVNKIKNTGPILSKAVADGTIKVVGAYYNLQTGKVDFYENDQMIGMLDAHSHPH